MKFLLSLSIVVVLFGCSQKQTRKNIQLISDGGIDVEIYNYENFKSLLHKDDPSKTYIINFWATWCKPCVAELPFFERLYAEKKTEKVEVVLVSLDMLSQVKTALIPFIKKHKLQAKVILLDDPDVNSWIPKVNANWSGSIPATIIYNTKKQMFYEQSFTYETLNKTLNTFKL